MIKLDSAVACFWISPSKLSSSFFLSLKIIYANCGIAYVMWPTCAQLDFCPLNHFWCNQPLPKYTRMAPNKEQITSKFYLKFEVEIIWWKSEEWNFWKHAVSGCSETHCEFLKKKKNISKLVINVLEMKPISSLYFHKYNSGFSL